MRALTRYAAPVAALVSLTIGLAPAAGASVARPMSDTHAHVGPAETTVVVACPDHTVSTAGVATETITKEGRHTVVRFTDAESGDGFAFVASGIKTFGSHGDVVTLDGDHHDYRLHVEGTWYNLQHPLASFHRDMWVKVFVHDDEPTGFESWIEGPDCGS